MAVTEQDVTYAYRMILGREPENSKVVAEWAKSADLQAMRRLFMSSREFTVAHPPRTRGDAMYDGLRDGDEALLRKYLAPGKAEAGFVGNFLGVRMQANLTDYTLAVDGYVYDDIPTSIGDYHAEPIEFVGMLRAIEAGAGAFVAVELGAGWGSWSVTAGHVARAAGRSPIRLYAVEGSTAKYLGMQTHFANNGFEPDEHTLLTAAIGPIDGYALFPLVDATKDFGAEAIFVEGDEKPEKPGYEVVRSIRLATLIADEELVDLIHFDVQGAEREIIDEAIGVLNLKARYVIVGTHSRAIEGAIFDTMRANAWQLINEQPARIVPTADGGEIAQVDGTQVWRNPRRCG